MEPERVEIGCDDGVRLGGHLWPAVVGPRGRVVVNAATGVLARYYHRYARFLAGEGFEVLTYDYRGIGLSRPARLHGCRYRWREWGERDLDAALRLMDARAGDLPLLVVGHSIGGVLPGLAPSASRIARLLTVGAQSGYWGDYARDRRLGLFLKWHIAMPLATALCGYFPGRQLGWLEDLPRGVANEWAFRRVRMEHSHPAAERAAVLARFAAVRAQILAVTVTDDEFGTPRGVARALAYFRNAERMMAVLTPGDLGMAAVGHFDLFHARHERGFWVETVRWLRDGVNPWAGSVVPLRA